MVSIWRALPDPGLRCLHRTFGLGSTEVPDLNGLHTAWLCHQPIHFAHTTSEGGVQNTASGTFLEQSFHRPSYLPHPRSHPSEPRSLFLCLKHSSLPSLSARLKFHLQGRTAKIGNPTHRYRSSATRRYYSTSTMQFGKSIGTACTTFAITNIDDMFVLVTFFAEAATSTTLTPLKITLGQYIGFTIIVVISMIGFGVSLVLPSEPIGFLGLLPILLGVWKLFDLLFPRIEEEEEEESKFAGMRSVLKVSVITLMNGGDNIGTYIPLFSQAKGSEIAVYVIVYYILMGVWCLAAFLVMRQKHVLFLVERYLQWAIPFLYMGLGVYIIVESSCYPWSIEHIDDKVASHPGQSVMAVVTTVLLLTCISAMLWLKLRKKAHGHSTDADIPLVGALSATLGQRAD
ncbi:hypothetical protein BDZ45DRAFT_800473 [Acephala macrosclerotiorum]|nr:hypothetical protein BDZ45DRAFT_800473 [Acephala macrosclerotiorum]